MSTAARTAAFGAALVLAFVLALGVGRLTAEPAGAAGVAETAAAPEHGGDHAEDAHDADREQPAGSDSPGGLAVAESGLRLEPAARELEAGRRDFAFRLVDDHGAPLTRYQQSHDEDLHLIAVRRDLSGYQHAHPTLEADGTWRTTLDLTPGTWRVYADVVPGAGEAVGRRLTLGTDLQVAGTFVPVPLPEPAAVSRVDGYTVRLDGALTAGADAELVLSVDRDGRPVADLQPYLGAYGHLVVLREGDLAYLHVHPEGAPGDGVTTAGPDVAFAATAPSVGRYRAFFDFRHGGTVRTAELTLDGGQR